MFCSNCGMQIPDGSRFCVACGKAAGAQPEQAPTQPAMPAPHQRVAGRKKADIALLFTIINCAVIVLSVGAYFLFFAGWRTPAAMRAAPSAAPAASIPLPAARQTAEPTTPPAPPPNSVETVSEKAITVDMAYDSGEGVYTGEVKDGVPHGQGKFEMRQSDNGISWSYEGAWENGTIAGEGVKTEGHFVFAGSFKGGLSNGECEITDNGVLRYKGMCRDGKLHGQGTLYTSSGTLIFEGMFENDMLVESEAERTARGEAFKPKCEDMDALIYDGCMAQDNISDYAVKVWGFPLGMAEQRGSGTIIIGHFAEEAYPVCLLYRYGAGERKMTADDWINAWGVVTGLFEYEDSNGNAAVCPLVEVIYWDSEQEGP